MRDFLGIQFEVDDRLSGNQFVMYNSERVLVRTEDGSIHEFTWDEVVEIQKENPGSASHK